MEQCRLSRLARKLILGGGVLLLIEHVPRTGSRSSRRSSDFGRNAWHGFWGVVLGLLDDRDRPWVVARMFGMDLPAGSPRRMIVLVLGVLIFVFAVLKNLTDDYSAWPSYVGMILAAVVAYGAWLNFQDSDEALPSMPRTAGAGERAGAATSEPAAPPTPPAEAPPPPAAAPPPPPESEPPAASDRPRHREPTSATQARGTTT